MIKVEAIEILKWKEKSQVWKTENLFFFRFHKITYILTGLNRGSCLIPAWSHEVYFPIVHDKVMNDEPESHHSRSLFFMTMTCFSENGLREVSLIQNAWEKKQFSLIIMT